MELTEVLKIKIDSMNLKELYINWRENRYDDPMFSESSGKYYMKRMFELETMARNDIKENIEKEKIKYKSYLIKIKSSKNKI